MRSGIIVLITLYVVYVGVIVSLLSHSSRGLCLYRGELALIGNENACDQQIYKNAYNKYLFCEDVFFVLLVKQAENNAVQCHALIKRIRFGL